MNKKGLSWGKIVVMILAVVVLVLLILFAGKINVLKEVFGTLFSSLGGVGG